MDPRDGGRLVHSDGPLRPEAVRLTVTDPTLSQCEDNERGAMTVKNLFHEKPRTAFVLGGGGNLGAIQVGQLRALLERNIVPDAVIGCSVGALNGAAIAGNPTLDEANRMSALWKGLGREDIFSSSRRTRGPLAFIRQGVSAYNDSGLRKMISEWLSFTTFEETVARFSVVATHLHSGVERWFEKGDLTGPLLASTALPGAFPPVDIHGETYIDGGVVNNVPISKAFEMKAKRVYVLDVGNLEKEPRAPKRPYEVLMQAVTIARAHRFRTERDMVPEGVEMVRMPAIDVGKLRYDDFSRSAELIERSYKVSAAFLDKYVVAQTA
jgi:NTE family protein